MQDKERNFSEIIEAETVRKGLEKTNMKTTVEEITGALHTKRWKNSAALYRNSPSGQV